MGEKVAEHAAELDRFRRQLEGLPHFHQYSLSTNEHLKEMRAGPLPLKFTVFEEYRASGHRLFDEGKFQEALKHYEEALSLFRWLENGAGVAGRGLSLELKGEEPTPEVTKRLVVCYSNIAICNLKLENFKESEYSCDEVLKLDPDNAKAKYRKAVALSSSRGSGLEDLREAIRLLKEAVTAYPNNFDIKAKLTELVEMLRTQEVKTKEVCKTMMSQRTYEDVQPTNEVIPKNRLQDIATFIERGETTIRQLEAEGKHTEAEKVKSTVSRIRQAHDELKTQLDNLKSFKEGHGVTLLDALSPSEIRGIEGERGSLLPSVPKVAGQKKWDWLFVPAVVLVSIVTFAAYLIERRG